MEEINELRYYLEIMKGAMAPQADEGPEPFKPTYLVTAVQLPTGAIELAINDKNIPEKIEYILNAYDDDMHLKSNPEIIMKQLMVV